MDTTQLIEWYEPYDAEGKLNLICRMTKEDAIQAQYKARDQVRPGFVYESDQQALDDFMVIHWAREVNGQGT
jgi:hypothetical protein